MVAGAGMPAPAQTAWRAAQSGQVSEPEKPAQQPAPPDQSKPAEPDVQPVPAPCVTTSKAPTDHQAPCNPSTHKKRHPPKTVADSATGPSKTIVRHGSTSDPNVQLGPGVSPQQASKQLQTTTQLLARTNVNLTKLEGRTLNADQQETVKQVKHYMDQSQDASGAGDVQRAYNLALKASLLSSELVKH
jgi:hypothetical protein